MSCGVGPRHGSDLGMLWLWCRPTAVALIQPLVWEVPYATSAAIKNNNNNNKMTPTCSIEVPSNVPKCEAVRYLMEKMHVA